VSPKISRAQGPTVEGVPPRLAVEGVPPQQFDQHRFFKGAPPADEEYDEEATGRDLFPADDDEEETPSAGTSSEPSSPISEPTPEKPSAKGSTRRPARMTGNRS
jgi:hypothetical protein